VSHHDDLFDQRMIARAIELALTAQGRTRPNPLVGCVITRDQHIIAQGYHARAGLAHAEIDALRKLTGQDLSSCVMYVTLEPCCHHGRTPPCTDAILASGLRRVVIGARDMNPRVNGAGAAILRAAGVEVVEGVLADQCAAINRPYQRHMLTAMPWVVAKWAMSLDGKIATHTADSQWITSEQARARAHALRDQLDAIMVGSGTLRADNPRLTCRLPEGRDPWRFVLDARLEDTERLVYADAALSGGAPTVALVGPEAPQAHRDLIRSRGHQVVEVAVDAAGRLDLSACLGEVARAGMMSVLVEGGAKLLGSLWDQGLVDEVVAFVAPSIIGGLDAPSPVAGRGVERVAQRWQLDEVRTEVVGSEVMWRGIVRRDASG
jgi:diaminohydroxyphosphoribosylaminopyrimidine deaminase/5-amino-6-(5-phosphoribosylamino)uracil reductase